MRDIFDITKRWWWGGLAGVQNQLWFKCYDCINYYDDFNLFVGMLEHIYFICLAVC